MTAYAELTDTNDALVLSAGEGRRISVMGNEILVKAGATDTAGAFSIWEATVPPHFPGPYLHWHKGYEIFYLLEGRINFRLGEEERSVEARPGAFVLVPPGVLHTFANPEEAPARLLSITLPGGFEGYFEELAEMLRNEAPWPPADMSQVLALAAKYDSYPPPAPRR
ncbi:MAG TPA: cupin domain-containing protein [Chthonomonadaceae bacterium]|nr:cupin domain-containing protein [Chthonomonadaceae bacterium]